MEKRRSYKVSPYDLALSIKIDETRIVDPSEAQYLVTNNEFPWNSFRVRALSKVFPRGKSIDYTKNDFPFSFLKEIRLLPSVNGLITLRQSRDFSISMDYFSTTVIEQNVNVLLTYSFWRWSIQMIKRRKVGISIEYIGFEEAKKKEREIMFDEDH